MWTYRRYFVLSVLGVMCSSLELMAQTTVGRILGAVTDTSGASISQAEVTITNEGTSVKRTMKTDQTGTYDFENLEPGMYTLEVQAPQFSTSREEHVDLQARQTIRLDATLSVASARDVVNVTASAPVINTETSNIAQTKTGQQLIDLPVTLGARQSGSTSPFSTLTAQPGVQTDSAGNLSVLGGQPSFLSITVDGISTMGVRSVAPLAQLFPSLDSIEEIRVSESNNSAEFGNISDITTISRSGTNLLHGAVFWNYQNDALNASNPFSSSKPFEIMNDFGGSISGPIIKNRTFYLATFEGLRLPQQQLVVDSVPSVAFRQGNLSSVTTPIYNPATGAPFVNNQIPVNPVSATLLNLLFPLPNYGAPTLQANNYRENLKIPISSNQGDGRIDQVLSSRQSIFARFTYKDIDAFSAPTGTAIFGAFGTPEHDWTLTVAHTFIIRPNLLNEIRGGVTDHFIQTSISENAATVESELGINGLAPAPAGSIIPNVQIAGYTSTGGTASSSQLDHIFQVLDNLSWIKDRHTVKIGGNFRHLETWGNNVGRTLALGVYNFTGAVTSLGANGSTASASNPPVIGNPFAAFLLGVPDTDEYSTITTSALDAYAREYALYVQDDWQISRKLTVNYGLRWEYNPMFHDHAENVSNFLPDYYSIINGQTVHGAVVVPNLKGLSLTNPGFAASIYPTPIITAQQAGIPSSLRYSQKTDFAPRFGFAYRPFSNNKTVLRGAYGKYFVTLSSALVDATYGTNTIDEPTFTQKLINGQPSLQFPSPFPATVMQTIGTQTLVQAVQLNFKDPYVQEWNFTLEQEIARDTGIRVTYNGTAGSNLETRINQNQVPANTVGYSVAELSRPYPLWGFIETEVNGATSRYNAGTVEVYRRLSARLQFQSSYTLAKNLSNVNGIAPTTFVGEGGSILDDRYNPGIDIGNVAYTRRQRFLTTFLAQLPFGRGRAFAANVPGWLNAIIGGWEFAGVMLVQTGPFLTATVPGADPSGTGLAIVTGSNGRPDIVSGQNPNLPSGSRSINNWFNAAAFVVPQNNIGRFGDAPVGDLIGPGTVGISGSLLKRFQIKERFNTEFSVQSTNLINHENYAPPNTVFNTAAFGKISGLQTTEGAGPRVVQLSLRIMF